MGISLGWVWILLPVCQALVVPREVSSRTGETLSIRCWYPRGYEGYNKYWCQGDSRDSCHKVVETKGREVPWQHGRVSIEDNHVFCVVLLTVKDVSKEDAGNYWCGIERTGRDLMEPVTVRVVPAALGNLAAPQATRTPTPWISNTTMDSPLPTNTTITGPGQPALSILVPIVVLLSLLVATGSVGLLCTRRRRRGAPYKPGTTAEPDHCPIYDNELDLAQFGCSDTEQDPELEDHGIHTNALCLQEKTMGMPGRHFPGEAAPYLS
ncbi:PREDICTED: CMRF35-like molecule 2 [Charadrius vociferus]|uniref:CMRF35-like molecule 2 n=1 Tax=Charadrius vociferus TaxID=50402 RepID=UPI0005214756|nr:PREDICTED: CMRF35-like molecule 2 [Charadrius vociferus]